MRRRLFCILLWNRRGRIEPLLCTMQASDIIKRGLNGFSGKDASASNYSHDLNYFVPARWQRSDTWMRPSKFVDQSQRVSHQIQQWQTASMLAARTVSPTPISTLLLIFYKYRNYIYFFTSIQIHFFHFKH